MIATECENLKALYLSDETAWLETMAELIGQKELGELDYDNLREFLTDMALSHRREVLNRLVILIAHHLKWQFQPNKRSLSWRSTIREQSAQLTDLIERGVLLKHAESVLPTAYRRAVELAAGESEIPESKFPAASKLSAREWLALPVTI